MLKLVIVYIIYMKKLKFDSVTVCIVLCNIFVELFLQKCRVRSHVKKPTTKDLKNHYYRLFGTVWKKFSCRHKSPLTAHKSDWDT